MLLLFIFDLVTVFLKNVNIFRKGLNFYHEPVKSSLTLFVWLVLLFSLHSEDRLAVIIAMPWTWAYHSATLVKWLYIQWIIFFFCNVYLHLSGVIKLYFVSNASKQTPFFPLGRQNEFWEGSVFHSANIFIW